ncbi:hypothetical protein D9M71_403120 [compost metagenome]
MYLLRALVERTRRIKLYMALRNGTDAAAGQALVAQVLPLQFATAAGSEGLELLRRRLLEQPPLPIRAGLGWSDFRGALGVFLLVVCSTFPLVVPFILLDQTALAIRLSNLIGLVVLFIAGWLLARYAGATQWQGGVIMAATGGVLILAIIALGG